MNIEIRADGAHISGYVNVTEKRSHPVITPRGKVVEEVEPRAFERAIERADSVPLTKDHDPGTILAETRAGTLSLYEDGIGLHYDAVVADEETVAEIRAGKVRGMSFGMKNVVDAVEERADDLPLRRIKALDLDHITLVVHKIPYYSATSIELRADERVDIETRAMEDTARVTEDKEPARPSFDNSAFRRRVEATKK